MAIINERIKHRRLFLNMTLDEVARHLGVTEATMQRYESGSIKNIPHMTIEQLALIFDCQPAYLMGWVDEPQEELSNESNTADKDPDIRMIARARNNMSEVDRKKMMNILKASFDDYFNDKKQD